MSKLKNKKIYSLICLLTVCATVDAQSIVNGQRIAEKNCFRCHGMDVSADAPALRGIVGRKAGSFGDYFYSEALSKATHYWTATNLKIWLTSPEKLVPGVEMDFHLDKQQDIDDVVAYLESLK